MNHTCAYTPVHSVRDLSVHIYILPAFCTSYLMHLRMLYIPLHVRAYVKVHECMYVVSDFHNYRDFHLYCNVLLTLPLPLHLPALSCWYVCMYVASPPHSY